MAVTITLVHHKSLNKQKKREVIDTLLPPYGNISYKAVGKPFIIATKNIFLTESQYGKFQFMLNLLFMVIYPKSLPNGPSLQIKRKDFIRLQHSIIFRTFTYKKIVF